jgi:hypothetical protein
MPDREDKCAICTRALHTDDAPPSELEGYCAPCVQRATETMRYILTNGDLMMWLADIAGTKGAR